MILVNSTDLWEVSLDGKEDSNLNQNIYGIELNRNSIHFIVSHVIKNSAKYIDLIEQCNELVIYKYNYNYLLQTTYKFNNCYPSGKDWVLNFEGYTETNS